LQLATDDSDGRNRIMAAHLLGQVIVHDMQRFAPYVEQTTALIERHGGEVIDVVQAVETVEGSRPEGALTAIVRFPDERACARSGRAPRTRP
jgi:uncharacterized protein (DUF1330 family)